MSANISTKTSKSSKPARPHPKALPGTICSCCDSPTEINFHHTVPFSEGGTEMVPLCKSCHIQHHSERKDWQRWGSQGGRKTASNPQNWMRNLRQYRKLN